MHASFLGPLPMLARCAPLPHVRACRLLSFVDSYIWSPEVYGRKRVTAMANTWWSLPSNKYNCFSCCTTTGESIVNDRSVPRPHGVLMC